MIIHCSTFDALAEVGNYRSSRVMPLLLASVTGLIAAVATPHLSHDWEAGRRQRVSVQMNLLLKLLAGGLTAVAVTMLAVAPILFQVAFRGKYAGGLAVMPWTLTYCAWFGLTIVAQKYLWCAERVGLVSVALVAGLAINVGLNLLLLPRYGLLGAVLATAAANAVALTLVVAMSARLGFRVDHSTWALLALPVVCCLGPWNATLILLVLGLGVLVSDRLLCAKRSRCSPPAPFNICPASAGRRWRLASADAFLPRVPPPRLRVSARVLSSDIMSAWTRLPDQDSAGSASHRTALCLACWPWRGSCYWPSGSAGSPSTGTRVTRRW